MLQANRETGGRKGWTDMHMLMFSFRTRLSTPDPQPFLSSGVPRNFVRGGVQQIQLRTEDRENGDLGGGSPLVRGSGGSYNLVQEISFHMVKFS